MAQGNRVTILQVFQSDGCMCVFKSAWQLIYKFNVDARPTELFGLDDRP